MSKNFEVLLRAEREAEVFGARELHQRVLETELPRTRPQPHIDPSVHHEEIKLIERVFLFPGQDAPRVVVFCGIESRGGSAGICARAGQNLAKLTGVSVCLVDADLHASSLHDYFGVDDGLKMCTAPSEAIRDLAHRVECENLFLLSASGLVGNTGPAWKSDPWPLHLKELRREFHYVLIAAPPVARDPNAVRLGQGADGVILVLESQLTRRETARAIKQSFAAARVQVLGAVLNNHIYPIPDAIYKML